MDNFKIVLLGGTSLSTKIVFNAINKEFGICLAIIEEKENKKIFLKRRIKRLGYFTVLGQLLFQLIAVKVLNFYSKNRRDALLKKYNFDTSEIPFEFKKNVSSINNQETQTIIKEINPDLIIVNGTRILSKKLLSSLDCKIINTHAGITPKYRGVHGAYWALINNDKENCGVTVHFVDEGIDTGKIISQEKVEISKNDTFITYPLIQLNTGLKLLKKAIIDLKNNTLVEESEKTKESNLYYHPTLWFYLKKLIFKRVK